MKAAFTISLACLALVVSVSGQSTPSASLLSGKGDWIHRLDEAMANLPTPATDLQGLINFEKGKGMSYIIVKAGEGNNFYPASSSIPKLDSSFVTLCHDAGLKVFGYHYIYGGAYDPPPVDEDTSITLEIAVAKQILNTGCDGLVLDPEIEYQDGAGRYRKDKTVPLSAATAAQQYFNGIRQSYPTAFIAYAPFWNPSKHSYASTNYYDGPYPYRTFNANCQAVIPQAYYNVSGPSASQMVPALDAEWTTMQNHWISNGLSSLIKPIIPAAWGVGAPEPSAITGADITTFANALRTDTSPAVAGGYTGVNFWDCEKHHTNDVWNAIGAVGFPSSSSAAIKVISRSNGVPVPGVPVKIDGYLIGTTDSNGKVPRPFWLCGNHFIEAVLGNLHFNGLLNLLCGSNNSGSGDSLPALAEETNDADSVIEMESDGSCATTVPINNFQFGNVVEVFGTGDGLRARYPNPCSDSYITMPDGSVGTIVGGPQCCNGYIRWKIHYNDLSGIDLWSAEGESSTDQSFLRLEQSGTCTYSLSPARLDLQGSGAAASGFNVTTAAGCNWAAAPDQSWITISSNGVGPGPKQVTFAVSANPNTWARAGKITVGDQTFVITQLGTSGSALPDLKPYTPPGWSSAVVFSNQLNDTVGGTTFYDDEIIYVNHSFANLTGSSADRSYSDAWSLDNHSLGVGKVWDRLLAYETTTCFNWWGTTLAVGAHTFRFQADSLNNIVESDESNNTGTGTVTIIERPRPKPVISSSLNGYTSQGAPFQYQITATNQPTSYGAAGLPGGLSVNTASGLLSGTPTGSGTFNVTISASNGSGTDTQTFVLTVTRTCVLDTSSLNGAITRSPNLDRYVAGTQVWLTAVPSFGYQFTSWTGDVSGVSNPLLITMDSDKSVSAVFGIGGASNLEATAVSSHDVALTWTDNSNGQASFVVERKGGTSNSFQNIGTVDKGTTGWVDSYVSPNTAYTYRVVGSQPRGVAPYSNECPGTANANLSGLLARGDANFAAIAVDESSVYWSSRSQNGGSVWRVSKLDGSLTLLASGLANSVYSIAVEGSYVYWAESNYRTGSGAIRCAQLLAVTLRRSSVIL